MLSPRIGISYLPHQEIGVRWMLAQEAGEHKGGILGDDMGLGKTFQTIGLLKNGVKQRTLIVCPPALVTSWKQELENCGFSVAELTGVATWSKTKTNASTVWLTTYPKVVLYDTNLKKEAFQRIILDEGHAIRNGAATARWTSCMAVAAAATYRWILSATPIQNGKKDWRNLCSWLHVSSAVEADDIMLRRTMADLRGDIEALPPPPRFIQHDLSISESGAEGKLFRVLCDSAQSAFEKKTVSVFLKLERWMRIQQFLVHPQIYIEAMREKMGRAYLRPDWAPSSTTTKWTACMAELQIAVDSKVGTIVFCNFRREMDMVEAAAAAMGAKVFSVRGGMGSDRVGEAVTAAREAVAEGEAVVFVVQIVSGGAGLNLQFCRRILFLSQHWNPAVVHQAVGRAVRIGQGAVVDIHLFRVVDDVMDNLDRRMVQVHLSKISDAREICGTLYEGFAPLKEESFPSVAAAPADADATDAEAAEDPV
jgi:SNF2 family DNA or RNA helicase